MNRFDSILLPLDGSVESGRAAGCAAWLAQALGATLHVLHATEHPPGAMDPLSQLRIPHARNIRMVTHQLPDAAETAVLEEIAAARIDLVVMSARGESADADSAPASRLGHVAQAVIQRSPVPVVLLPRRYRESLPWTSMLAAASGEAAADQALGVAVRLAAALRLKVTAVLSEAAAGSGPAPLGDYADAPHHEYPQRLEQLFERGLGDCRQDEAQCAGEILVRRGNPGTVLLEECTRLGSSVLAIGWHGVLGAGRALVFKRLLDEAECALLLVRGTEHLLAHLKVGSDLDEQ